jgi:hypothetical protein
MRQGNPASHHDDKFTEPTITRELVDTIGQYDALQNELTWSYLIMELDVTIDIKPSTKPDAIIQGASDRSIVEKVKILSLGLDEFDAVLAAVLWKSC